MAAPGPSGTPAATGALVANRVQPPKRPVSRVENFIANALEKNKRPRLKSRHEARTEAARAEQRLPPESRPIRRFIRNHVLPPLPNIYTRLLEGMRKRPNILNPDSPLAPNSTMKLTENKDSDGELVKKYTALIHFYKFAPYLFIARAKVYIRMNQPLLSIGDCVRAIKLCEIMKGITNVLLRGKPNLLERSLTQNAQYIRENFDPDNTEAKAAADPTKMAEEAGIALIEACVMLPVNLDSIRDALKPVFAMTADAAGGSFEKDVYTTWYNEYTAALSIDAIDEEAKQEREYIRKRGPEYTALIEHFNQKVNYIEYNRGHYGLSTVWEFLKGKVDNSLLVCPQQSKMIPWNEKSKGKGRGKGKGKDKVPQTPPQGAGANPELQREKAEALALARASKVGAISKPLGMIVPTDLPAKCKISHDKTNLVVQDTGNFEPPYYCERCWIQVKSFKPGTGLICCYHALRVPKSTTTKTTQQKTQPYAPTVYCSQKCKVADKERHNRFHRVLITSAYESAAAGNDFPLFVAKCFNTAESPGINPLTLGAVSVTLEQFGQNTRHLFSIQRDLIAPWNTLLDLGYDIFGERQYDTWVLLSLKHKWANNKRVKVGGKLSMMFPIRAFYNHSCESNAIVGLPVYKGKNEVLLKASQAEKDRPVNEEVIFAKRAIKKGEEVTISYIGSGVSKLSKKQRVKALRKVGIDFCECTLCTRERDADEERKKKRLSWLFARG